MKTTHGERGAGWMILAASLILVAAPSLFAATSPPITLFREVEDAGVLEAPAGGDTNPADPKPWIAKELTGASGGKVLFRPKGAYNVASFHPESKGLVLDIPREGAWRIWIRYFKQTPAGIGVVAIVRDEAGDTLAFHFLDQEAREPTETPWQEMPSRQGAKTGFVWESFSTTFERPLKATLHFISRAAKAKKGESAVPGNERQLDCVVATTDLSWDPGSREVASLPALATRPATAPLETRAAPPGFVWSKRLPATVEFFAGIDQPDQRFLAGLIHNSSVFADTTRMIRMGFNSDHSLWTGAGQGIRASGRASVMDFLKGDVDFKKAHPEPEGLWVNAEGKVGKHYSIHYPPWIEAVEKFLGKRVQEALSRDNGSLAYWMVSLEEGGWMDYSPWAQTAFRKWLKERHGTIEELNRHWKSKYSNFDQVTPAKSYEENRASWLEFREFGGQAYARLVGWNVELVRRLDPKHRPCRGASSTLDIDAPYFLAFRPNDFEELFRVGFKGEKERSFDLYCADDQMGNAIEFFRSIVPGCNLINQEFSVHTTDPRIAARTYWVQVAKGIHGIHLFQYHGLRFLAGQDFKWSVTKGDGSPKLKLAAFSDAAQEVHRIEPLLMAAKYTHAVKPVAIYWSRIDLGLDKPHESLYGQSLNDPNHLYETLRGLGYPVRWITPRQITEGDLKGVAALVMPGANHVPQAAAQAIESWVKAGGVAVADSWPGAFDEYGQPQAVLEPLFGARPLAKKAEGKGSTLALQESSQGYGDVTDTAVQREKYFEKIEEAIGQPWGTHPVARELGDFMVSGFCMEQVECVRGKIIGPTHLDKPCFIVNEYGKGRTLYSAMLLGTIWGSAPLRYEWDTAHSSLDHARLWHAFLKYAGAVPGCQVTGLAPRIRARLRVESPLVTPEGNVMVGLTSMNDDVVKPFDLEVELPSGMGPFAKVLVAVQGNRRLEAVAHQLSGTKLRLHMPSFDTHAMILVLKDAGPIVSLELKDVERGPAALAMIKPGQTLEARMVVHNPSPRELKAGRLALALPAGWLQSAEEAPFGAIAPGGEAGCSFRIRAPSVSGGCRIEPLVARFQNTTTKSTPATEMVWWGQPPEAP
jgi:hypothetical protein